MSYPVVYNNNNRRVNLPHFDPDVCDFIEQFGKLTVYDDRHDLYQLSSRRHPAYGHHWIPGAFMVVLGQMGNIMTKIGVYMQSFSDQGREGQDIGTIMRDFIQGMTQSLPAEIEESLENMKTGVKEERAVPLSEYKAEFPAMKYSDKPLISPPSAPQLKNY